ncbi:CODH nickel-insertion accessory protein [Methanoregula boonei 6A8]|uniref:CODH nickel-insertion accessory protein n=1 Tax=Methanoregula boonei (strain DSM 21154 / JCM 14090 / 6A8) TaxID=456442 RepID=A7I831_METB6|nr:AAA family ATPase [Methanoregula boonei]ABS55892.1 CODH nickel-insertion accessory protein [Methanoregula boonei 6A8]
MKTLVTMGRGGTGKTSFVALQTKFFLEQEEAPLLLIDLDPDQNLAEMVGVDLEREGVKTIAELVTETFIKKGGTMTGIAPTERIESRVLRDGLYESEHFDLIAVGTKWIEGCYCMPDAALKGALSTLAKNYRCVLVDSPAGLEHLNRKVTASVSDLFDVLGPSHKSFLHVKRADRIAREVGIAFDRFFVVGGSLFPAELGARAEEETGREYLGKIAFDPLVQESVIAGRPLLDLPVDSPGYRSVCTLMERAGYGKPGSG